jgi:hypothetical protein
MNIDYPQSTNVVTAKMCGCSERQRVIYAFSEEFHSLCMDKNDIVQAEIEACEKLLKYTRTESERVVVEKEIDELKTALDLMP